MPENTTASGAADRVTAYLDRRAKMRGIDKEVIHGLDGVDFELTVSDLRALAASAPVAPAPQPVGAGEQSLRNAFGVWAETQGNGEVSLLDVLSPIEAEAAFDNWKLTLVAAAPKSDPTELIAGLVRCEFDDGCDFCNAPEQGIFTRLIHNAEGVTEAGFHICGGCLYQAISGFTQAAAPLQQGDYPPLPEPLEIHWPDLNAHALGCGVEDRGMHDRYGCAEYGWQDGVDRAVECVPEEIYDAEQMRAYVDADRAARGAAQAAPADQRNTKTHDLLSTMIGLFMGQRHKIGYKDNSVIAKVVAEAVEHLKDWPYPKASPAPVAEDADDAARWRLLPLFMQGYDVDWVELLYNLEVTFKRGVRAQAAQPKEASNAD